MWILLFKFLFAHFLGDFVLQTRKMVRHKDKPVYFAAHIVVHAVLLCLFLWNDHIAWGIVGVVVLHAAIDYCKLKLTGSIPDTVLFVADQLFHFLVIATVLMLFSTLSINFDFLSTPVFWLALTAIVVVTQVTAVFIRILLTPYQHQKQGFTKDPEATGQKVTFAAGKYIGILERLFIMGFVIANFWEGIGFLLAAKSIFRFGDLNNAKERHLTEYVLIGTLLSFGCAILIGLLFNYVSKYLI